MTDILFLGPFPPPIHGQSVATGMLYNRLMERGLNVRKVDTAPGETRFGSLLRLWRFMCACVAIATSGRVVYTTSNSKNGLPMTLAYVLITRMMGKSLFIHHHSFRYIAHRTFLMSLITLFGGRRAYHVVNCTAMGDALRRQYPSVSQVVPLLNTEFLSVPMTHFPALRYGLLTLGHLSNLCEAKGVGRAVEIFRAALGAGLADHLVFAGPFAEESARTVVEAAQAEFGARVRYLGAVYGRSKTDFFQSIDVFVFPTWYEDETVGIVNLEALAHGVPVISSAQCCIPSALGDAGIAIQRQDNMLEVANEFLSSVLADPGNARNRARQQFETLTDAQRYFFATFVELLAINAR